MNAADSNESQHRWEKLPLIEVKSGHSGFLRGIQPDLELAELGLGDR